MSLDNVIAGAAAANGSWVLLMLGLAISIPLVVFGSSMMIKLMARFPVIITLGAALIGWIGGETITSDVAIKHVMAANPWLHYAAAGSGATLVIVLGRVLQWRKRQRPALQADLPASWRSSARLFSMLVNGKAVLSPGLKHRHRHRIR